MSNVESEKMNEQEDAKDEKEVIVNGDAPAIASDSASTEAPIEVSWNQGCKDLMGSIKASEVISQEDTNLKLLRSLSSAWNSIALIMRNKSNLDTLSMDDLYNNLKGQASSSTYADDVMFSLFDNQSNGPQLGNEDLE
ncbi:hypothetical protein Tco_0067330 [Tanacetum coccineum]